MFRYLNDDHDLHEFTVLLPSLGVGNVAQLTVDLIVSTLKMEKLAVVWHSAIVPIVGPDAFDHGPEDTTTACELYICRASKLAAIQLRSPLSPSLMDDFFQKIITDFANQRINRLLVLTSSYAYEKHLIGTTPFEFLANPSYVDANEFFERLGWKAFAGDVIYGGGFAKRILDVATEHNVATAVLFKYVSEGDNRPDATEAVAWLDGCLGHIFPKAENGSIRLIVPVSWKLLFGNSAPAHLY